MGTEKAILLVSLDFEMYWGVRDLYTLESCKQRLENTRAVVTKILRQFEEHGIHATWATVGLLFSHDRAELMNNLPRIRPDYDSPELSPYPGIEAVGRDESDDPYRYAPSLIEQILKSPGQEIGTHTFSHYYCLENGQTKEAFRNDLEAADHAAKMWGVNLRSLVFPRNHVNPEYLDVLAEFGIQSYRGCERHWIYRPRMRSGKALFRRAARLLDAYVNLSGHHTFSIDEIVEGPPFNFPSSRLLRMYLPALRLFEPLRVARICSGLDYAAHTGRVFHLWFHPEELAMDQDKNAGALEKVLDRFALLRDRGEMESLTMAELAARLSARSVGQVANLRRVANPPLAPVNNRRAACQAAPQVNSACSIRGNVQGGHAG